MGGTDEPARHHHRREPLVRRDLRPTARAVEISDPALAFQPALGARPSAQPRRGAAQKTRRKGRGDVHLDHLYVGHEHRSEEHTSELQSLMRISYAVFCLKKKTHKNKTECTI